MPIAADVYQKIVDAKVYIDEHFDSPIDLDAMPVKPVFRGIIFTGLFRRIYRRTPHQYLMCRRSITRGGCPLTPGAMGYDEETRKALKLLLDKLECSVRV